MTPNPSLERTSTGLAAQLKRLPAMTSSKYFQRLKGHLAFCVALAIVPALISLLLAVWSSIIRVFVEDQFAATFDFDLQ